LFEYTYTIIVRAEMVSMGVLDWFTFFELIRLTIAFELVQLANSSVVKFFYATDFSSRDTQK